MSLTYKDLATAAERADAPKSSADWLERFDPEIQEKLISAIATASNLRRLHTDLRCLDENHYPFTYWTLKNFRHEILYMLSLAAESDED